MKKFNLNTIYNAKRPLSWSAISSFEWNKSQWYKKYILGELPEMTPELEFGSYVDKRIQSDADFLPALERYPIMQHKMTGTFNKIPLIGYADGFDPNPKKMRLKDDKTGRKPWDQKRADETGQLTMYLFMLYLRDKIQPEDVECYIDWLPTHIEDGKIVFIKEGDIRTFKTRRSMREVLAFGQRIKDTWEQMEAYGQREADKELTEW